MLTPSILFINRGANAKIVPTLPKPRPGIKMTPEFVHEQLGKLEIQVNEMRAAIMNTQVSLGKIDTLGDMMSRFTERYEVISARNEKSLERIHDRIDVIQREVSVEIDAMRRETREMHDSHRESVADQVRTSMIGIGNHVTLLDDKVTKTKEQLDSWQNEVLGMTKMAKVLWTVMGGGVIAIGAAMIQMYSKMTGG